MARGIVWRRAWQAFPHAVSGPQLKRVPLIGGNRSMNDPLEALGSVGDFVGGLGVLITLIYLALQIKQNTRSVRAAAAQQVLSGAAGFLEHVTADPVLTDLFFRGAREPGDLAPPDRARLGLLMLALFRRFEAVFQQGERGILAQEDWAGLQASLLVTAQLPYTRQWWPNVASLFSPSFRNFVESLQRQPAAQQGAPAAEPLGRIEEDDH
jgi:hypothetical protein